jgi:transcriptional regulator GlxA family with amidase domain
MTARTIVVIAFDGVRLLDVSGPLEVFTVANEHGAAYAVRLASLGGQDIVTSGGVRLGVDAVLESIDDAPAILLVPGSAELTAVDERLLNQVERLAAKAQQVVSVCAGAFVLAAAGLLDHRRVATHWGLADRLASDYPAVEVDGDAIFVDDGHVMSSAGISSGIDLALAVVERDYGAALARTVAKQLVVFMQRPGGQSQFSARLKAECMNCDGIRPLLDSVVLDPAGDHRLASMAGRAALSVRQLTRLFRREIGQTPARDVEHVRVEHAKNLLENGRPVGRGCRSALRLR